MTKPLEEIFASKPEVRPRIYAYSIDDTAHEGVLKVGQTTRDVKERVAEQLKTANIKNYTIVLDEPAERDDGITFTDHQVRNRLKAKGFDNSELEWVRCSVADVQTVLTELPHHRAEGSPVCPSRDLCDARREQAEAGSA